MNVNTHVTIMRIYVVLYTALYRDSSSTHHLLDPTAVDGVPGFRNPILGSQNRLRESSKDKNILQ